MPVRSTSVASRSRCSEKRSLSRRHVIAASASAAAAAILGRGSAAAGTHPGPLFDAHIHYNYEIAAVLTPHAAVQRLREAGIARAIVSSTPDEHTLDLHAAAPDLVIPFLRPYRSHADRGGWLQNADVLAELERRLARTPYQGIGELHINPLAPQGSILPRIVHLARERRLWILAHVSAAVIDQIYALEADARVIWAHAGGLVETAETVAAYVARYPGLALELSLRSGLTDGEKVTPVWLGIFAAARGRVMLGTDTWINSRWDEVGLEASFARRWLAGLPAPLAEEIAVGNGRRMFG